MGTEISIIQAATPGSAWLQKVLQTALTQTSSESKERWPQPKRQTWPLGLLTKFN